MFFGKYLGIGLVIASLIMSQKANALTPEKILHDAIKAYGRSEYQSVITMVSPLLYPKILLANQNQVILAHKLLGISYLFEKKIDQAEKHFLAILSLSPEYRLDPLIDPTAAVDFFEEIKLRNVEKLKAILEREKKEADLRRQNALRQEEKTETHPVTLPVKKSVIERTIIRRQYWVNFLPLGAGQFQNGHSRKGYVLMGLEMGLGGLSLATALTLRFAYPNSRVSESDYDRAKGLAITQVVSGGLFFATVAYGIIDALIYYNKETVMEKRIEMQSRYHLTPVWSSKSASLQFTCSY